MIIQDLRFQEGTLTAIMKKGKELVSYSFNEEDVLSCDSLSEEEKRVYSFLNALYSYAMEREIYHLSMFQAPSFMMFTWLPLPDMSGDKFPSIDFEGFNIGRYAMPLYTFAYPVPSEKVIKIRYLYRTSRISENVIRTLHANALKAIIDGIDNPEKTMGEIKAGLKDVNEQ